MPETLHHDDGRGSLSLRDGITIGSEFESEIEGLDEHDLDEEEKGLIEEYLHSPASLHIRRQVFLGIKIFHLGSNDYRTLDQYYYHMLSNTDKRDVDQVVSRWACRIKDEPVHNILMVDQLWLWKANSDVTYDPTGALGATRNNRKCDYIVSCFPGRAGAGDSTQQRWVDNLRHAVLLPRNKQRDPILQSRELVSRILTTCFDGFDRLQSAESVRFFNIFEDTIGAIVRDYPF